MESIAFLHNVAQQFSDWRVLLDILVFTLIIYLLYRTLRATGTWQIVLGITIAASGAGLASFIGLRGVEWIFSNFSQVALIALLIIFQPEIRKILERTTSIFHKQSSEETKDLAALISDVVFALSKKRWGGIIVIPGTDSLKQWVSEGIEVNALPSFSLLLSIFDPSSPGHDGAIIIENGLISRLSVRLPLSQQNDLPEIMGTRHHASLGLSEKTDALIITVSEERGTVSVFLKGKLISTKDPVEVTAQIMSHGEQTEQRFIGKSPKKERTLQTVFEAGICFTIACLFWFTVIVSRTQTGDMIFTVPIHYTNLQPHLVLSGDAPEDVKLHLEGQQSILTTLDLSFLKVQVDLSNVNEGLQTIRLSEDNVQVGKKVRILDIDPSAIDLHVAALKRSILPVEPQFIGQLPDGIEMRSVTLKPDQVQVFMPETDLDKVDASYVLRTTPIYLHGLQTDTTVYSKIISPSGIQPFDRRWPDIEIKLEVGPSKK